MNALDNLWTIYGHTWERKCQEMRENQRKCLKKEEIERVLGLLDTPTKAPQFPNHLMNKLRNKTREWQWRPKDYLYE